MDDKPRALGIASDVWLRDCTHDHPVYMVHDRVWRDEAGFDTFGKICIPCLETHIGRSLEPSDFYFSPGDQL